MAFPPDTNKDCVLAWEAMPDALQHALAPRQAEWLDAHLAGCESCRTQFAQQQRLQRALSLPTDLPFDAGADLARLLARIDNPDIAAARDAPRATGWAGRALVAAVLVQAIGLGVMGTRLWSSGSAPEYRTLGREAAPAAADAIRLVPDPAMTVAAWDALLRANRLRVVAGPNDVGGYLVVPAPEVAARATLVRQLRQAPGIRLAEPVAGPQ